VADDPPQPAPKPTPTPTKPVATPVRLTISATPVQPFHIARVAVNYEDGDTVDWEVSPDPPDTVTNVSPGIYIFSGTPGTKYTVTVDLINFDTRRKGRKTGHVQFAPLVAPTPVPPGPTPPVPPVPPQPTPVATGAYVIVVVDENNPTRAQEEVATGVTLTSLKAAGKCRVYGSVSDSDKLASKGYDRMMTDKMLTPPAVFVLDKGGKVVISGKLPNDDTTLAATLKGVMQP